MPSAAEQPRAWSTDTDTLSPEPRVADTLASARLHSVSTTPVAAQRPLRTDGASKARGLSRTGSYFGFVAAAVGADCRNRSTSPGTRASVVRCPYQKSGTCCGRCRCGPGLIPSARACPRSSSLCSPPSSLSCGRVSRLGRRFSPSGINLPSCNARRRSARGWVTPIAGSGCSCRGCGGIGEAPFSWSDPTPSCDGIVAGSQATGAGDRRGDDPVGPPWLPTCGH